MNKYKRYGLPLALSVLAALPVMAQSTTPSREPKQEPINLNLIGSS